MDTTANRRAVLRAAAGGGALALGRRGADAIVNWCRRDPVVRVELPNGAWKQANCEAEIAQAFEDNGEARGDLEVYVAVPRAVSGIQYKRDDGTWASGAPGGRFLVGAGFGGHAEYVTFSHADATLEATGDHAQIAVRAAQAGSKGGRAFRFRINPLDPAYETKLSAEGTLADPPPPVKGRI